MSTPPQSVPLPPPIDSAPKGGCWKVGVIGCGAAAVVVVLLIIAAFLYFSRRPETMFDIMMSAVEANFAPDVTEEDKRELREAYTRQGASAGSESGHPHPQRRADLARQGPPNDRVLP
jgi:hypothetical protein